MPERIQLSRRPGFRKPAGAVVVSRPHRFGNPFLVADAVEAGEPDPHRAVVEAYRTWLTDLTIGSDRITAGVRTYDRRWVLDNLHRLAGRDLCCWCAPFFACHATVLLELANAVTVR